MSRAIWVGAVLALGAALTVSGCGGDDGPAATDDGGPGDGGAGTGDSATGGCGDGVRRSGEVCDDGNTEDGDGCSADCTSDETCGNAVLDLPVGELCDDGNTDDGDDCRGDCLSDYRCGNGVLDLEEDGAPADEVCDDGNTVNGDGCNATCDSDESCGNGVVDLGAGEVCDDGNTEDGDDCSADCMTSLLCGNGTVESPEECDDGNTDDGDGCDMSCRIERCGNGRVDSGEECDDGNDDDTDGCTSDCAYTCSTDADCDDGDICNGEETCADAATADSACEPPASAAADGTSCGSALICLSGGCVATACGDGFTDSGTGEECDDGNATDGDGCDNDCTFTCSGDGDCDDGNACNGDETCSGAGTTSSACAAGTPLSDGASCGTGLVCNGGVCTSAGCGDGIVSGGEDCDDGNTTDGDGCDNDCTWTCSVDADCDDGTFCNGDESCSDGGTLASRCNPASDRADGTSCGTGLICVSGSCASARCGDGIVSGSENCDDGNTTDGDGCDNDCTWTCSSASDCTDGDLCNGSETCSMPGTSMSSCEAGTPPPDGTECDRDGMASTRDICRSSTCRASSCGDGFVDTGATPAEECDDGNTTPGDGCSSTCAIESITPTAFRVTNLDLISPRVVVVPLFGCSDVTQSPLFGFSVNGELDTAIRPMSDGGDYSLHIVNIFRPLAPASATTPVELHLNPICMEAPDPDSCGPDAMPDMIMSVANNQSSGTCFDPDPTLVNTRDGTPTAYSPTANTVSAPCFISDEESLTVTVAGIEIPLQRARVAATYSGSPPDSLVTGVVTGFLTETAAADVVLPDSLPLVGGDPLYSHLQAGNRSVTNSMGDTVPDGCNVGGGTHEDDADTVSGLGRGFWFFLNFEAELITWTGP